MEKKKFISKLRLNKEIISNLSEIRGGSSTLQTAMFCTLLCPSKDTLCNICHPNITDEHSADTCLINNGNKTRRNN